MDDPYHEFWTACFLKKLREGKKIKIQDKTKNIRLIQ